MSTVGYSDEWECPNCHTAAVGTTCWKCGYVR
jgi:hypothetical protein